MPSPETQKTFLQLQTLICLWCVVATVCAEQALSAWGQGIPAALRIPLEEEPLMASKKKALRVWPLALESRTKLAAALGHVVIEHLQSQVGRDINTFGLYAF